jgi:hypothetical protein
LISKSSCLALVVLAGCSSTYYKVMEKMGYQKRHILSSRIKEGQSSQEEAKKQFQTTLERLKTLVNFKGGNLEKTYNELKGQLDRSEERAETVRANVKGIEDVAADMFAEWKSEMKSISNPKLRDEDRKLLAETKDRYNRLHDAFKSAESKMEPVLVKFRDQVTYLKHHLNASAIASLQGQLSEIESSVGGLIQEMEKSISEAQEFAKSLEGGQTPA